TSVPSRRNRTIAQTGRIQATATKAIPSGASGRPGNLGQPSDQLITAANRTYTRAQTGGASLSIGEPPNRTLLLCRQLFKPGNQETAIATYCSLSVGQARRDSNRFPDPTGAQTEIDYPRGRTFPLCLCADSCDPMLAITTTFEHIGHWIKMRQSLARFTGPESSPQSNPILGGL